MDLLRAFISELWFILTESGVWLLFGLMLAGAMHVFVPRGWLERQLGQSGAGSGTAGSGTGGGGRPRRRLLPILKASALGLPLPLCSCAVIPVAAGLRRGGASKGASAAFAISTPQTGEESIPLTWALFGPVFALTRPVVAILTAATAGILIDRFVPDGPGRGQASPKGGSRGGGCCSAGTAGAAEKPEQDARESDGPSCCAKAQPEEPASTSCCSSRQAAPCCAHESVDDAGSPTEGNGQSRPTIFARVRNAAGYGFGTMLTDLAPWLAFGFVAAAAVAALLPEDWIGSHIPEGAAQIGLALLVGLPLYICATSSTPLAWTLVASAGLSPGAALVLLLAGPASNAATMSWAARDLGLRALAIYLATIAVFAAAGGLAFDAFLRGAVTLATSAETHEHGAAIVPQIAAGAFSALLLWALGVRAMRWASSLRRTGPSPSADAEPQPF